MQICTMGRKRKYYTEVEKKEAQLKWQREHYERNKKRLRKKARAHYHAKKKEKRSKNLYGE